MDVFNLSYVPLYFKIYPNDIPDEPDGAADPEIEASKMFAFLTTVLE